MEVLNNLGLTSTSGFFGLALLIIGGFMVLAGFGIISVQQVTVKQGRATWVVGLLMAGVGGILLYPDLSNSDKTPENAAVITTTSEVAVVATSPAIVGETDPTATLSTGVPNIGLSEWEVFKIVIPGNGLWREEDGRFTATGSTDTIAWSEDLFSGDIELSFDIQSSNSFSAANVILYGNGGSFASGNLIFTIASDHQSILADSIYDNGTYLFTSMNSLGFGEEKYAVHISVVDRMASMYLDGEEIASTYLDEKINQSGKIGLMKYWEIQDITFSNIRVRESGGVK